MAAAEMKQKWPEAVHEFMEKRIEFLPEALNSAKITELTAFNSTPEKIACM